MMHFTRGAVFIISMVALSSPVLAAKSAAPVVAEIDHNIMDDMPEIDHNAIPEDGISDATIVLPPDPKTIGKPRPKAKPRTKPAKEIPLIDTEHEGRSSDDVTYVTGGVGKDERAAIEATKSDYNLYVLSARAHGEFVGDTRSTITRTLADETEEMLNVESGPLLYVRLPQGNYTLMAQLGEQSKTQKFTVSAKGKPSIIRLSWKNIE